MCPLMVSRCLLILTAGAGASSGSGGTSVSTNGFTMSADFNMGGNEVVGLGVPSTNSSATNKKYVDDKGRWYYASTSQCHLFEKGRCDNNI